jgi:transcription elongation GreA/GreB family factor
MKEQFLSRVIEQLEQQVYAAEKTAAEAHSNATHAELKSDSKYNTQATEAGYLAGAQKQRLDVLKRELHQLRQVDVNVSTDQVRVGHQVTVQWLDDGRLEQFFLLPAAGGIEVEPEIQTLSSVSPMGRELIGLKVGDLGALPSGDDEREFEVTSID